MRLVNFTYEGNTHLGAIEQDKVVDLNTAYQSYLASQGKIRTEQIAEAFIPNSTVGFLQGGQESLSIAKEVVAYALKQNTDNGKKLVYAVSDVRLEAPIQKPSKIICVGQNYREHILEMGRELPKFPVLFAKYETTIRGPQDDIEFYPISEQLDYEAELAVVIGKRARNVSQADALNYVAGYTVANDVTYRDFQRRTMQWLQGKAVDGSLPLGPWLVTSEELPDPSGLQMTLTVNGEVRQNTNTDNLVFNVPFLVEYISNLMTLEPGDIILTGTPGGVGTAMNPPSYLKDGDVVKIEISKIGTLENTVKNVK